MGRLRVLSGREVCRILQQHGFGRCAGAEVISSCSAAPILTVIDI